MTKHTATPWEVDYRGTLGHIKAVISPGMFTPTVCRFDKHLVAASLSEEERKANAAFICRACNSHEALIEALKQSTALLEDIAFEMSNEAMQVAKYLCLPEIERNHTALKLAEGRE